MSAVGVIFLFCGMRSSRVMRHETLSHAVHDALRPFFDTSGVFIVRVKIHSTPAKLEDWYANWYNKGRAYHESYPKAYDKCGIPTPLDSALITFYVRSTR